MTRFTAAIRRSLSLKLVLVITALAVVALSAFTYINHHLAIDRQWSAAHRDGASLASVLQFAAESIIADEGALDMRARLDLQRLVEDATRGDVVKDLMVVDKDDTLVARSSDSSHVHSMGEARLASAISGGRTWATEDRSDDRMSFYAHIHIRPGSGDKSAQPPIAMLHFHLDLGRQLSALRQATTINMLLAAAAAFGLGIVLFAMVYRIVLRPARQLALQAERIGDGDLSAHSGLTGASRCGDEMQRLAASLDGMTERLRNHHADGQRTQDALQQARFFLEKAQEIAHVGSWVSAPDPSGAIIWSREAYRIFGVDDVNTPITVDMFFSLVHPDDLDRVRAASAAALLHGEPYDIEHRIIRPDGAVRWLHERADVIRDASGRGVQMIGVAQDITEHKRAEQRQRFLKDELDHRVKNNLAAVMSIAEQTIRSVDSMAAFRLAFMGRVSALARTHQFLASVRWDGVDLEQLISLILNPYMTGLAHRITLAGAGLSLPTHAATPLSMALHELATNAVKYGSLGAAAGRVQVNWFEDHNGDITLQWIEQGGPIVQAPLRRGFGTDLIEGVIEHELHGELLVEYQAAGLHCTMKFPRSLEAEASIVEPQMSSAA